MLCFIASTLLAVLWLGETCPMPWAHLPGRFWCSALFLWSTPFSSLLWVNPAHSVTVHCFWYISYPHSLHSSSPHKVFFPIPSLKSRTKAETGGKGSSRTFLLAFESRVPKTGRGFSSKLTKSSILQSARKSLMVGASKSLAQTRCPWFVVCRSGQGTALQQCSPCGGSASSGTSFAAACGSGREFLSRVRAACTGTHQVF